MNLCPKEFEKLQLQSAGYVAQKRLAEGVRLNIPEAVALLTTQIMYFARVGKSVATLMDIGRTFLGLRQVIPGDISHSSRKY